MMGYLLTGTSGIVTVFWVWMVIECMRRGDREWIWVVIFLGPLGGLAYFIACCLPRVDFGWSAVRQRRHIRELEALHQFGLTAHQQRELGDLYRNQKRWADAVSQYQQAIEASPSLEASRLELAACLSRLGRHEDALAAVQPIIEQQGFYRERATLIASELLLQLNRRDQALALLKPLYHPTRSAEIQYHYGVCLKELQQPDEAKTVLSTLISLEPVTPKSDRVWVRRAKELLTTFEAPRPRARTETG